MNFIFQLKILNIFFEKNPQLFFLPLEDKYRYKGKQREKEQPTA